jgi:hypothetical protein
MASPKTELKTSNTGKNRLIGALICLQFVAYLPAYADDSQASASWIKQSLSKMATKAKPKSGNKTASAAEPAMMPFVPNRHLPSQHELIMAEQARYDESSGTQTVLQRQSPRFDNLPLSATVSAYGAPAVPAPISDSETRAWQDEAAATLRRNRVKVAHKHVKAAPGEARTYQAVTASAGRQEIRQTGALLISSPMITPDERTMVDGANQMTGGGDAQGDDIGRSLLNANDNSQTGENSEFGSAGPPPFPLNLIPPQALHDLIARGHHTKIDAPPVFFGSWHQTQAQSLPSGGFHSNIGGRSFGASHFTSYAPAFRPFRSSLHKCRTRKVLARVEHAQPTVLTYPAYSRVSMF